MCFLQSESKVKDAASYLLVVSLNKSKNVLSTAPCHILSLPLALSDGLMSSYPVITAAMGAL